jgi:leucyl aminopeptidase (aminopeptidase T)
MSVGQAIRSLKMKPTKQLVLLAIMTAATAACTASVRVMPGPQDTNWVVARDIEKHWAEKAAHRAALEYCEDRGLETVFISDQVWYEGMLDEQEREAIRRQSEAATVVGGIMRGSDHTDAALILESAGAAGSAATSGRDYTAKVQFTCRQAPQRELMAGS